MLSPLKESIYFARQHIQPLLSIALLLSLPVWLVDYWLPTPAAEDDAGIETLVAGLVFTTFGVLQFATAMCYIHQQVLGQPIGVLQAISRGASRLGPLLLINLLMALAIGLGLILLILPGLYMAYKLLFSEFFLLFHGQRALQAMRSSYSANQLLSDKLLPPLLVWLTTVASAAIGQQMLLPQADSALPITLLFEAFNLLLTIWGWALLYRLYQRYIAPTQSRPAHQQDSAVAIRSTTEPRSPDQAPTQSEPETSSESQSRPDPTTERDSDRHQ